MKESGEMEKEALERQSKAQQKQDAAEAMRKYAEANLTQSVSDEEAAQYAYGKRVLDEVAKVQKEKC